MMTPKQKKTDGAPRKKGSSGAGHHIKPLKILMKGTLHPALIPGIGVEDTPRKFPTNWLVLGIAGISVMGVVIWGFAQPDSMSRAGEVSLGWVMDHFGWLFSLLAVVTITFMFVVGYSRTGGIRLGADDEKPEFSTKAWIAMLFSAGMGIGLLFWGPAEPMVYFLSVPPGVDASPGTQDAMQTALAQSVLHWGPLAWAFYALVGGAIAYAAYRRGRAPLISAIFRPIFKERTEGPIGGFIDMFAIIVTLFGTAVTLGMGTLQIASGMQYVTGAGPFGNGVLIAIVTVLTGLFVVSAVSGIKRGIRILSNINMVVAGVIGLSTFVLGPTLLLLNLTPATVAAFLEDLWMMLARNSAQGEEAASFMSAWTNYYWAWWISWTPFVGMFIAKISRGRTLREFVTVTIVVPSAICIIWFSIMGGSAMLAEMRGEEIHSEDGPENVLFNVLHGLPFSTILAIAAMISIILFFVTSADSAAIVMGSMSQRGKPEPSTWITIMWGVLLGAAALALLLVGGETALSGLQSIMVVTALPFAFILIGIIVSWTKELRTDPYMLRHQFARAAIAQGVRRGIEEHGDDFVFEAASVGTDEGAGADIDTSDPALSEWYTEVTTDKSVTPEDIARTLRPGRIQPRDPEHQGHAASGESSMVVGESRRKSKQPEDEE